ncbi:DMT family transporter [Hydrogenophaga sp. PAMC20947]|uniref:DMT family transporter n=1 Tax=Hydrogenophaga sp. PAMC20947 TaxID=2565558 RepID=UPI00268D49C0
MMGQNRSLSHTQAVALMVVAALLWSSAGVVSRQLESAVRFEVTFWRSAFTVLSLLFMLPVWRQATRSHGKAEASPWAERHRATQWVHHHWGLFPASRTFWLSGVCWSVMFTAFMLGLTFTSVANVLIIMSVGPLFTAVLAWLVNGQRLHARVWGAIVLAGGGMAYMYGGQVVDLMQSDQAQAHQLVLGSLIALCVPVAGALNWTLVQRSQQHGQRIDLVPAVLVGACLSCVYTWMPSQPFQATSGDLLWLSLLGLTQLAMPCMLAVIAARTLKAPEVSLLGLLEVIFGILWPWLFVHEAPGSQVLLGGGVVIFALVGNEMLGWHSRVGASRIHTLSASAPELTPDAESGVSAFPSNESLAPHTSVHMAINEAAAPLMTLKDDQPGRLV